MKTLSISIVLFFFCLTQSISTYAQRAVSIEPQKPKIGDELAFVYSPELSGTGLQNVGEVTAEILFLNDSRSKPESIKMEQAGNQWKGKYKIQDKSVFLFLIKFKSGDKVDDNSGDVWKYMIYGTDGQPVKNAWALQSFLYMSGEMLGFKVKTSKEESAASLDKELSLYPNNIIALSFKWGNMMKDNKKEELKKEVLAAYKANKPDENTIAAFSMWFKQLGMEDPTKALTDSIIKANPKGKFAFQEKLKSIVMNNASDTSMIVEIPKLFDNFPDMVPIAGKLLVNKLVNSCVHEKEYDKAMEFIEKYDPKNPSYYNLLAWPLIEKGEMLDKAVGWAQKGIGMYKNSSYEELKAATGKDFNKDRVLGTILDTYAYGMEQLGKTGEALKAYEESFRLLNAEDESINQRYVQLLVKDGKYAKAVEVAETSMKSNKANDKLIDSYKIADQHLKGSSENIEIKIGRLKKEALDKKKEEIKKGMVSMPAPNFNLKDFEGSYIKLSDLKGKVVVVDFWATWCGPCKASFPALQKVYEKYKNNPNVAILAIDTWENAKTDDDKEKKVKDFIAQNNYTFKVLFDTDFAKQFEVKGIPAKFIIDKEGAIRFKSSGFPGEAEMITELNTQIGILLEP